MKRIHPPIRTLAALALLGLMHVGASAADVVVFSTPTFKGALGELAPAFERATGNRLLATYASAAALEARIESGEPFEVALLLHRNIDALARQGRVDPSSVAPLARAAVGVAVHATLAVPDVGTEQALRAALSQARSFAYGPDSASGAYFMKVLDRLHVPDAKAKLRPVAGGAVMDAVAKGEADMTVITVPNIIGVPGVTLAGKLPESLQNYTAFAGGVAKSAPESAPGRALLRFVQSDEATRVFARHGLDRPS